ncbi:sodium/calcium exchanger protein [Histoplasma capsulatum var. duboisii H88]|uniref:Sodium/calcium exchanger protein n=2 Tax=Ajellomyces capsulatus TaxID=5037 RepID=F0UBU0_AJEC8|nr:sodium/calcium exchanger protein [Histoplasma capsulatum var. duboisii H88]QSS50102.1 sodium/calcium exchanger protein [Histoplasma capsulatum var. duboisii H88]
MATRPSSLLTGALTFRRLRSRYSSRPFYLTLLVLALLAGASVLLSATSKQTPLLEVSQLVKRSDFALVGGSDSVPRPSLEPSDECHLVHKVKDQCSFVRTYCGDHEIGIFSYLQLYYCKLAHAKPIAFAILAVWLAVLFNTIGIAASDFLCVNLSTIASILGMSESLTGVTFLAFGNGSPDVFSTFAAMNSNSGGLAIGELVGAAGFITAVVAGSMALVRPFRVARRSFVRDVVFFIFSASFTMVLLADGKLYAWECVAMILSYLFYVFVVVTWHWYLAKKRRQRERDLTARAYFHIPENQELEEEEEEEDDDPVTGQTRPLLRGPSSEDFNALERADVPLWTVDDVDEDADNRDLAEIQGNMRVTRGPSGSRRPTITPIRPSLVGALEFRSVLSSLQKARQQSGPIHLRRYSDEIGLPRRQSSVQPERPHAQLHSVPSRLRSSSVNEPSNRSDDNRQVSPNFDLLLPIPQPVPLDDAHRGLEGHPSTAAHIFSQTGLVNSPSSSVFPSRSQSPVVGESSASPILLAPPKNGFQSPQRLLEPVGYQSADISPGTKLQIDTSNSRPTTASLSPTSAFPPYSDTFSMRSQSRSPRHARRASLSAASSFTRPGSRDVQAEPKPISWWPYRYLPSPHTIAAVLFPTLYDWRIKPVWEILLGVVAAPSVLLLTITLPVVEPKESEPETPPEPEINVSGVQESGTNPPQPSHHASDMCRIAVVPDTEGLDGDHDRATRASLLPTGSRIRQDSEAPVPPTLPKDQPIPSSPKEFNRWLLVLQLLVAPCFIALIAWSSLDSNLKPRNLLLSTLVALLASAIFLTILLLATKANSTPNQQLPRRFRPFVAFLGFVVSIAWISTLASEVVNLLKAIGVILSISDSLLGLTIFAVGNSLGDLVADITVARLGYPVMALSACFGGPMLNILLGVGMGGLYMTLQPMKSFPASTTGSVIAQKLSAASNPYEIELTKTLLISAATLLVTLVLLLIIVPLNGWWMDRKIGWGLVALWTVTTVANVVLEVVSSN